MAIRITGELPRSDIKKLENAGATVRTSPKGAIVLNITPEDFEKVTGVNVNGGSDQPMI